MFRAHAPVVQTADNSIHRINHYQVDSVLCFGIIYPLDSDLSRGERYLPFEQPGLEVTVMLCLTLSSG